MKRADLLTPAADWTGENWAQRIDQCASMLFCHGYIPMSQREKIATKLKREFEAAAAEAGWTLKPAAAIRNLTKDEGEG